MSYVPWKRSPLSPVGPLWRSPQPIQDPSQGRDVSSALYGLSPVGQPIVTGYGAITTRGRHIVDPKRLGGIRISGEKLLVNLVMCIADTALGGTFSLVWARINDEFIIKLGDTGANDNEGGSGDTGNKINAPSEGDASTGKVTGQFGVTKYRFYDGSQTEVDPLIVKYFNAASGSDRNDWSGDKGDGSGNDTGSGTVDDRSAWPGFVYIVFEDFDIAPFGDIPEIDFQISSDVNEAATAETQSTLTFGALPSGSYDFYLGGSVDKVKQQHIQAWNVNQDETYIIVTDIATETEISRVPVWRAGTFSPYAWDYIQYLYPLDGSDYAVATILTDYSGSPIQELAMINVVTGEITDVVPSKISLVQRIELAPKRARLLSSGLTSKFIVLCETLFGTSDATDKAAVSIIIADVSSGTLTEIYHPKTGSIPGDNTTWFSVDFGRISDGVAEVYACYNNSLTGSEEEDKTIFRYTITEDSVIGEWFYTAPDVNSKPISVAYNELNDEVVFATPYDATSPPASGRNNIRSVDQDGNVTVLNGDYSSNWVGNLLFNYGFTASSFGSEVRSPAGFVITAQDYRDWIQIDLTTGDVLDLNVTYGNLDSYRYIDALSGYAVAMHDDGDGTIATYRLGSVTPNLIDLQEIITALMTFDGRNVAGDLSFSNFPGNECYGVKYESDTSIADALESICEPFDITIVESDGKVKFRYPRRDGAYTVDQVIVTAGIVDKQTHLIEKTKSPEEESLSEVTINYFDSGNYGERSEQIFARPRGAYDITKSIQKRTFNLPLYMSAAQAQRLAATMVYRSVYDLETYQFGLGPQYLHVEPGDIVTFTFNNSTIAGIIKQADINEDYSQNALVHQYLQSIDGSYNGALRYIVPPNEKVYQSRLVYLDIPLVRTSHDAGGESLVQYTLMTSAGLGSFVGGSLWKYDPAGAGLVSVDGSRWTKIAESAGSPPVGVVTAITGVPANPFESDYENTISLVITNGVDDLASITQDEWARGGNLAAVGQEGRWVIISWKDVAAAGSIKTISNITFGMFGTEVFLSELTAGDLFVPIKDGAYQRFSNDLSDLNANQYYKPKSNAYDLSSTLTQKKIAAGVAEKPFAPVNLNAQTHGGDIELTWDWRSRLDPLEILTGPADTVHGEAELLFSVDIIDSGSVIRTLPNVSVNSAIYDSTDITTDFGSIPAELTFRVYMISAVVGRGHMAEATITL